METLDFFKAILPPEGWYYLVLIDRITKRVVHRPYRSLEELANAVELLDKKEEFNLYHACASYKSEYVEIDGAKKTRNPANWDRAKALWIDLDCGEDKAAKGDGYLTKKDAKDAVDSFCKLHDFPLPMVVDSGNGVHCYWPFTKAVKPEVWLPMANAFKVVLAHHKVLADPTVTADLSRILRPAGATNRKFDPKPVVVKRVVDPIDADLVSQILEALLAKSNNKPVSERTYTPSINDDLMVPVTRIPVYAEEIANHCEQFRNFRDTQGAGNYEVFRHIVGSMSLCEEGIELAHKWSEKRLELGHDQCDVDTKFNTWSGGFSLCSTFENFNPEGCEGCPHKGKLKSPVSLGRATLASNSYVETTKTNEVIERPPLFLSDKNGNGRPLGTTANVKAVLDYESVTTRYNQMTKEPEVLVPNVKSVLDETSNSNLTAAIDLLIRHGVPYTRAPEQINAIAANKPYCPVQQMIGSRPWDGISRFDSFMAQIETPHQQEAYFYFRKWLIQAIAAVYILEGLSAAGILVLTGLQGIGKTQLIRQLASTVPKGFLEGATLDPSNKDSVMTIASHWIVELGELDATFRKADLAQLKAFITKKVDKFRRPYAKKDSEFPRRTVMAGTVNDIEFLYDNTGNRRFWVIQVNAVHINHNLDIQQLWAEAKTWYDSGETWHLNQEEQQSLNLHNAQFEVVDPVAEKVVTKFNFENMATTSWLTAARIAELSGFDRPTKGEIQRVSSVVRKLNGNQGRRSGGVRLLLVPGYYK